MIVCQQVGSPQGNKELKRSRRNIPSYVDYTKRCRAQLVMDSSHTTMSKDTVPVCGMTLPMQQPNYACDKSGSIEDKILIFANGLLLFHIYGSSSDQEKASHQYIRRDWRFHLLPSLARRDRKIAPSQ